MAYEDTRNQYRGTNPPAEDMLPNDLGQVVSRKASKDEEIREQYNYYYNRIYPLLKENKLDFHRIAEKTGHKERRVRETLLFRLTTGEVMQLFGKKDGFCYICSRRLFSLNTKEPMCLSCLQALDTAIQELQLAALSDSSAQHRHATPEKLLEAFDMELPHYQEDEVDLLEPALTDDAWVPRQQYELLLEELQLYRRKYGPLEMRSVEKHLEMSDEDKALQDSPDPVDVESVASPENAVALPAQDAFLEILSMPDRDIPLDPAVMQALAETMPKEPIRHFGFQRMKSSRS